MTPIAVPVDIRGSGTVTVRQSTYLEVVADRGERYRIHYQGKREFAIAPGAYPSIAVEAAHPLLANYLESWAAVYVSAAASDAEAVAHDVESAVATLSRGWRRLDDYANGSARELLRGGHGLLLRGPLPVSESVVTVLQRHSVRYSMLHCHAALGPVCALVLGCSYVVAGGFSFERRLS